MKSLAGAFLYLPYPPQVAHGTYKWCFLRSESPIPGCHFQVNHAKLWDGKSWKRPTNLQPTSIQPNNFCTFARFRHSTMARTWGGLGQPTSRIFTVSVDHYVALVTSNTCEFGWYKLRGSNVQNAHWILKCFMWGPINYGKCTKCLSETFLRNFQPN